MVQGFGEVGHHKYRDFPHDPPPVEGGEPDIGQMGEVGLCTMGPLLTLAHKQHASSECKRKGVQQFD